MWLDSNDYPEVTFENSPKEVELVLPSQEPTIGDLLNQLMELNKDIRVPNARWFDEHAQTYGDKQSSFQERGRPFYKNTQHRFGLIWKLNLN